jgi:hypothetical protein
MPASQSSTVSSLTQSSGTNQASQDVLYGAAEYSTPIELCSTPSLSTWNIGLRCLHVPDILPILQLQEDDNIVLVLSMSSRLLPLYKGAILQDICQNHRTLLQTFQKQLANETLQHRHHEFKHLGMSIVLSFVPLSFHLQNVIYYMMMLSTRQHCVFGWAKERDLLLSFWIISWSDNFGQMERST